MKVDKLTVGKIFDTTERLEAPLFQRPYVWEQNPNWTPLWESIRVIAEKRLNGQFGRPHFLGAVVLDQLSTPLGRVHVRQIIDGQQRLTTMQVFLAAARDLAIELGQEKYAQAFKRLIDNDVPLSDDPDDKFKVWPTNADRDEFRTVITSSDTVAIRKLASGGDCLIAQAYEYFFDELSAWLLIEDGIHVQERVDALYGALRDELLLIVIDLDEHDDAQEIFETLNALGTPLLTADLVKNYLFRLAERSKEDSSKLYRWHWSEFDKEKGYWRSDIRQGRLKRPRIDAFLHNYLTLQTRQEINAGQLFSAFRDFVGTNNGGAAGRHLALFRSYADIYKSFDSFPEDSAEEMFFYKLDALDISTAHPLLLEVFKRFGDAEHMEDLEQILRDLESYFVRRTVCELTTKNYNKLFVDLIRALAEANGFSPNAIRKFLLVGDAEATRWPDDAEFSKAWVECRMYKKIKRSKLRLILESLDFSLRTPKTEVLKIPRGLTIEHLMPREWERHWPLHPADDMTIDEASDLRNDVVDTLGNLTLLTKELNPAVSNGPWAKKRTEILKHSALNLNRELSEEWNESLIKARTEALLNKALLLWKRPAVAAAATP
jgi:uncharacterized protein with ParB-like and HNH nuclease domain